MNNPSMTRIYLLYRNKEALPVFDNEGIPIAAVCPEDYCVAASIPAMEVDRLVDIYDMYCLKHDDMPRAATYGDVICHTPNVGMLICPSTSEVRRRVACSLSRILFDIRKAYNPFKVIS